MGKIKQLDSQTTNMIAAGEVVERPMGVVKELVENAIDAGSTRINIVIEQGGLSRITIQDNGCGMDSEDAEMAFHRHATSKIRGQNDLWTIQSLGFRGEALPSIAAVAKVTLCTSDGNDSTRIVIAYGETLSASSYPCNQGTEITVEDLFYRTPARLKHMRSGSYEASLIQDVVIRFALSHPEIAFHLISDGRDSFRTSGQGDLLEVLYAAFGRAAAENAIPVDFSDFDYHVTGYLIKPDITRASRNMMHVFLNGRMVKTYKLYKSIQDGYEDFLPSGRYPMCVLSVEMDPHLLDVNVHPSKWEVRISKEIQLEYLIRDSVKKILGGNDIAPRAEVHETRQEYYEPMSFDTDALMPEEEKKPEVRETAQVYEAEKEEEKTEQHAEIPSSVPSFEINEETRKQILAEQEEDNELLKQLSAEIEDNKEEEEQTLVSMPAMEVIGQYKSHWILCSSETGLAVVDQRAAMQRVLYEEVRSHLNERPVMQDLLVPVILHAGDDLVQRADELNKASASIHIEFEPFGRDSLLVRSVPSWMNGINEDEFLNDLLDEFKNDRTGRYARLARDQAAALASKAAVHNSQHMTYEEMKEVVRRLSLCENPYKTPKGKSVFIVLDEAELAKEFGR